MNTINSTPQAVVPLSGSSPSPQATRRENLPIDGQNVPSVSESQGSVGRDKSEGAPEATREALQATVNNLNEYAVSLKRNVQFSIDDELERPVIRVIDSETNQVIRQIPSEEVLSLARRTEMTDSAILDVLA